ncbi:hypothetical protein DVH05_007048 [Phytophthora capsici]|nr:hypothetical protein DVH05_007048 [Phytophthora capsici]
MPMQQLPANVMARGKRRARSSSSARSSAAPPDMKSESSDDESFEYKRPRRQLTKIKVGSSAQNPIALSSESSDDETINETTGLPMDNVSSSEEEWSEGCTRGGFDQEEEEDDEETEEDSSSGLDTDEEEESDEDLGPVANSQKVQNGKAGSDVEFQGGKQKTGEVKANFEAEDGDTSGGRDAGKSRQNHKGPRPLLTTSQRKRNGVMQTSARWRMNDTGKKHTNSHRGKPKYSGSAKGKPRQVAKKARSAPRNLLENTNTQGEDVGENDDTSFDLGVDLYGESPPRRPPSRVHSRANSVRSSPATSVVAGSPPPDSAIQQKDAPSPARSISETADCHAVPAVSASPQSPLVSSNVVHTLNPCDYKKGDEGSSSDMSMELTQVVLPPDRKNKYHLRVSVSSDKPLLHTIWVKNLSSHEQREYSFADVRELPGADPSIRVPTRAVLTALFRCLSSQPDAEVIVGPEPKATAGSKTTFEKGEVKLVTSTAEKGSAEADGGDGWTLVVVYPNLDLFEVLHNFPLKLVPAEQRLQQLLKEVESLRDQLTLVQSDRDRLCEQLCQQEEENERALVQQVEERVRARMATQYSRVQEQQSREEIERRVAKLVQVKTADLVQAQETEKRNRDRARRWVFAHSDWMSSFQPCRALIAVGSGHAGTSLLQPGAEAATRKYVVEWKNVDEIAEPFFQPSNMSDGGLMRSITVVKGGVYQVNANVSHDSLAALRLVVTSASSGENAGIRREISPTKVSLYDNKRRVSRVDTMLKLRALDQLSLELELLDSVVVAPSGTEEWLRSPMPAHNRFLVVVLDEHALHA